MRLRLLIVPLLCIAAGCAPGAAPLPGIEQGDGRAEWRGSRPCVDCGGIDVVLALERAGDDRRYLLVETYRAGPAGMRFVERGQWRQQADLLRLQGEQGGQRTFVLTPDGRLQSRDSRGRPLPGRDDAMLSPRVP